MPMAPAAGSNTINREMAGMKPRPSQCTATESDGEADAAMLWGGGGKKKEWLMPLFFGDKWHGEWSWLCLQLISQTLWIHPAEHRGHCSAGNRL